MGREGRSDHEAVRRKGLMSEKAAKWACPKRKRDALVKAQSGRGSGGVRMSTRPGLRKRRKGSGRAESGVMAAHWSITPITGTP